jgi:hypothetical protein
MMEVDMKQSNAVPAPARVIPLGKVRELTRASFTGNNSEMAGDRLYRLGG